jgi:hypothetical protein
MDYLTRTISTFLPRVKLNRRLGFRSAVDNQTCLQRP